MRLAVAGLMETPQNNFRVFRNGTIIYGDSLVQRERNILTHGICDL